MMDGRDSIDFGNGQIPQLFRQIFIPTLLGMVCMSVMTVIDGAFIGHGVNSDGLAAVNIFCPLWLTMSGIGLMFGIGSSVVASIHLSQNNEKAANINVTQAFLAGTIVSLIVWMIAEIWKEPVACFLGASDRLLPYVLDYQKWLSRSFIAIFLQSVGLMIIRLDGSPKYAMFCSSIPSIVNVILDYVFLYILHQGLEGVSFATAIGCWTGALMVIFYFLFLKKTIHLYRLKASLTSLKLTIRNLGYQMKLGFSAMLGDASIAVLMFVGNYVFLKYLHEDGVAAFSVACYIFPFIFMTGNAIAQSAQPIVSYNHGAGAPDRVKEAFHVSIKTCILLGIVVVLGIDLFVKHVVGLFLGYECNAAHIASAGIPWLSICFIPYLLNVVMIGYYQSTERAKPATVLAVLRGFGLMIPCFLILPLFIGNLGMWLAMPLSEIITLTVSVCILVWSKKKQQAQSK